MTERGSVRVCGHACVCLVGTCVKLPSNILNCMFSASFGGELILLYAGLCCKVDRPKGATLIIVR